MKSVEVHRRELREQFRKGKGIDPDSLPREYWRNYAVRHREFMEAVKAGTIATEPEKGCKSCRVSVAEMETQLEDEQ